MLLNIGGITGQMKESISKKIVVIFLCISALLLVGCSASDPLTEDLYTDSSYYRVDSSGNGGYYHEHILDAISLSPGGSGAVQVLPSENTLGGYQFDDDSEYIYFDGHTEVDWDGITGGIVEIFFATNVDNSGGAESDVVVIDLTCYHKLPEETTTTIYENSGSVIVGQSPRYKLFRMVIDIDNLANGEVIAFRLNLDTVNSDVDDIIVNQLIYKYQSYTSSEET